ncbi:MAG: hypothetical protein LBL31_00525 [Spirochaetaceae bacterium]|jgi:hypothetical protein|nr:hypothetical protein [Spirochaetaceae bacterium]
MKNDQWIMSNCSLFIVHWEQGPQITPYGAICGLSLGRIANPLCGFMPEPVIISYLNLGLTAPLFFGIFESKE